MKPSSLRPPQASSSWSATGGPGRSILNYFYRDWGVYGTQIVPFSGNSVISVQTIRTRRYGRVQILVAVQGREGVRRHTQAPSTPTRTPGVARHGAVYRSISPTTSAMLQW